MKWFKHYSDASDDHKISAIEEQMGLPGYAAYWKVVELCALSWDGTSRPIFTFTPKQIQNKIRMKSKQTDFVLGLFSEQNLFQITKSENKITIAFPKLLEIKDNHTKNRQVTGKQLAPRTEQNRLEQNRTDIPIETIDNSEAEKNLPEEEPLNFRNPQDQKVYPKFTPDHVIDLWNQKMGSRFGMAVGLGSGKHLANCLESLKYLKTKEAWENLFAKCEESAFLRGERTDWSVTLTWIIDYDNAIRVLGDEFNDLKHIKDLFSKINPEATA